MEGHKQSLGGAWPPRSDGTAVLLSDCFSFSMPPAYAKVYLIKYNGTTVINILILSYKTQLLLVGYVTKLLLKFCSMR